MTFDRRLQRCRQYIDRRLAEVTARRRPRMLYEPMRYVLRAGGKRVRPTLVLLACEAVGGTWRRAIDAAVAVEMLHTFTLIHDDIMDNADTRRGNQTIHKRWNQNTAILAGDEMVALAYKILLKGIRGTDNIVDVFTHAFVEVCEGQGYDEEFERRNNVSVRDYMHMIDKKTSAIIAAATTIGAMVGGGTSREVASLRRYGRSLGRAFQIQDDLLDVTAESVAWGKLVGGDVKEGKKSYVLIRALQNTHGSDRRLVKRLVAGTSVTRQDIQRLKRILHDHGIIADARALVARYTHRAQNALRDLRPRSRAARAAKDMLVWLAGELLSRKF